MKDETQENKKEEESAVKSDSEGEEEEEEEEDDKRIKDMHSLFQNDNYYQSIINSVWHGKKMPSQIQVMMENRVVATRRG